MDKDKLRRLEQQITLIPDTVPRDFTTWSIGDLLLEKEDVEYISSLLYEEVDRGVLANAYIEVRPHSQCVILGFGLSMAAGVAAPFAVDGIKRLFKFIKRRLKRRAAVERDEG